MYNYLHLHLQYADKLSVPVLEFLEEALYKSVTAITVTAEKGYSFLPPSVSPVVRES